MRTDLPLLGRSLVCSPEFQARTDVIAPRPELLTLPEKAIQFGTGAFLRGFVEYFLDEANRQGRFGGRVVMVGSTGSGRDEVLAEQDRLYTLCVQGMEGGEVRRENRVIGVVSRALSSKTQWSEVLACARDPQLELVFSNTTEVGITLDDGDGPHLDPPRSFPGKLTRFLLERAEAFEYDPAKGLAIVPCELIEANGDRLREVVLGLADRWRLGTRFREWLLAGTPFCNTLVDRIVPGTPEREPLERLWASLGYRDELLTTSEVYRLFVIQGDDSVRRRLPFIDADPGVLVTDDLTPYRERKVRLLNGTHSILTPVALLSGFSTVGEAVTDRRVGGFTRRFLYGELVPALGVAGAHDYASDVLDRFSSPFIRHALIDIMLQATMKMRVRVIPMIERHLEKTGRLPGGIVLGFAAHLVLLRQSMSDDGGGISNLPKDDFAAPLNEIWRAMANDSDAALAEAVLGICSEQSVWGTDLSEIPGFVEAVTVLLVKLVRGEIESALDAYLDTSVPAGADV